MQGRPTILTTEQIQEIIWTYDRGAGVGYLANYFDCGTDKIKRILYEHDLIARPNIYPKKADTLYDIDEFDGKICKGMSYQEYCRKAGYKN